MSYPRVPIGDLVSLRQGFAINKNTKHHISDEPTALPLLRIADMKDKAQNVFVKDTIPAHFIAKPEDIIYTRTGQVGLVFTDQYGVIHNNCFTVTPNDAKTLNRYYLYYVLQSEDFYSAANNLASGAAQPDLPHGAFRSIEIPVPPLASQMRIAEILKGYDDLIENNRKQIKLLEESAQRLYKEWFVDLRFPGHETTPITDGIPEGWCLATIGDNTSILRRGISPKYNENGPSLVINQKCIRQSVVDFGEARRQEKAFAAEMNLMDSDTVICSTGAGTLGRVGQIFGEHPNTTFDSHVTLVRVSENLGKQYLYQFLKSKQQYLQGMGKGSTNQLELSRGTIQDLPILVPPNVLCESFERHAQPIHDKITSLSKQITLLCEARDALLPKLMNGEIEV